MHPLPALAPQALAILDLETSGGRADRDRITEIGVLLVDEDGVREWSRLVQPDVALPAFITRLTGIDDAMLASASRFADLAEELAELLDGRTLVAHHARFDYGFLKAEFARCGRRFQPRTLCTVRLSRALYPDQRRHGLDAIAERHGIAITQRHRALDDARAVFAFLQAAEAGHGCEAVRSAVKALGRNSVLPPYLDADLAQRLPECPGVYFFHGEAGLLYVGKARDLRQRVLSHFQADLRDSREMRLSQQVRDITWETTAGELGALLREARYVKQLQPLHNRRLRRQARLLSLQLREDSDGLLHPVVVDGDALRQGGRLYGLFASRAAAMRVLRELAPAQGLCDYVLGLERRQSRPCPSRQLKRCRGWCDGSESSTAHNLRLLQALAEQALKTWPHEGPVILEEHNPEHDRREYHLVDNWCWLASADTPEALCQRAADGPEPVLDKDSYRLLLGAVLGRKRLPAMPLPAGRR